MERFGKDVLVLLALLATNGANAAEGTRPCGDCHAETVADTQNTPHALALDGRAAAAGCADCHGDPTAHVAAPDAPGSMLAFRDEPASTINTACGSCHEDTHAPGSNPHIRAGLACTDCHSVHHESSHIPLPAEFEALDQSSTMCFDCHQETFSQFAFNERHRLAEGSISCSSCHDPHAPRSGARLGGFRQAMCTECHPDTDGPFVFEHTASRVDGCIACHAPHGSPNRHMLTHQQEGELCHTCHAVVPQFHLGFSPVAPARFDESTVCTNCHVTIHGSNLDRLFLR
jgi:DmsE family decaheme c-type cytochrome